MSVKIKAHYLPYYQEDVPAGKICLLISDPESRQKIRNVTENLCGEGAKLPLKWYKKDCKLVAKADKARCMKGQETCILSEMIGLEVDVVLELRKYSIVSKYESNRGEKIHGTHAIAVSIHADV